jgi:transcriptional regulator with PAS, ATPase and Fis domain
MTVSKWHRTNGGKCPDPMEDDSHKPNNKEKIERRNLERKLVAQCPDYIEVDMKLVLKPKENDGHLVMKDIEKHILQQVLTKYGNNVEVAANCLNTSRRHIWVKVKEYGIEVNNV